MASMRQRLARVAPPGLSGAPAPAPSSTAPAGAAAAAARAPTEAPVWFITGVAHGLAREVAQCVLARGHRVAVTARLADDVRGLVMQDEALVLALDLTDAAQVKAAVAAVLRTYGRIDVLVSGSGAGYSGTVEESEEAAVRRLFEVNVFGLARLVQAVLPTLRAQGSGCIVTLSSIDGLGSRPTQGWASAAHGAVAGLSQALQQELAPLGVQVMLVTPGALRAGAGEPAATQAPARIEDYAGAAQGRRQAQLAAPALPPGDPVRAARAIVQAVESATPPQRLLLGSDACALAADQIETLRRAVTAGDALAHRIDSAPA